MNDVLMDLLQELSLSNDWLVLLPEILMALLAVVILGVDLFKSNASRESALRWTVALALGGQFLVLIVLSFFGGQFYKGGIPLFGGLIEQSELSQYMRTFFLFSSLGITFFAGYFFKSKRLPQAEYLHIALLATAGFMLLVQSSHFIAFFVNLELVTVAFYVLVAFQRTSIFSLEAGLKYLALGALSSAFLLFGIVLLYGISGNPEMTGFTQDGFNFTALQAFIVSNSDSVIVRLGALFVLAGIGFKIGLVPFQIWVPDVYQGAPAPTTAFLAIASKAAGIFVFMQLLHGPFLALSEWLLPFLSVLCAATILYGSIAASGQNNIKRLIGLSGISHAGYLLLGVLAGLTVPQAMGAVLFYLSVYMLGSFLLFAAMIFLNEADDSQLELNTYRGLYAKNPLLAASGIIGLGSLAGIPPLGGFIAKLLLFMAVYKAGLYGLLAVAVFGVVVSIFYYFAWIRSMVSIPDLELTSSGGSESAIICLSRMQRAFLIGTIALVLIVGLYPGLLSHFI